MPLDPSTLCARTTAGDAELAAPRHGLAIAQRRLLTLLDQPLALDELAARPGLQPERLERDLARLAEHGLIEVHRPAGATGPMFPVRRKSPAAVVIPPPPTPTTSPVLAGPKWEASAPSPPMRRVRRGRALVVGFAALAAVGAAIWLFATPSSEPVRQAPPAPAPAGTAAPAPVRSTTAASRPLEPVRALMAVPAAPERVAPVAAASTREAPPPVAEAVANPAVAVAAPSTVAVPAALPASRPMEAISTPPHAESAALPDAAAQSRSVSPPTPAVASPPSLAPTLVAAPPPVQLAAATPTTLDASAATRAMTPLTREAPEFPREALNAGVQQGTVKARLAIDAAGHVTAVDILDAQPRRVFDRAVMRTLARWTFEPGASGRTTDVEVAFRRE